MSMSARKNLDKGNKYLTRFLGNITNLLALSPGFSCSDVSLTIPSNTENKKKQKKKKTWFSYAVKIPDDR